MHGTHMQTNTQSHGEIKHRSPRQTEPRGKRGIRCLRRADRPRHPSTLADIAGRRAPLDVGEAALPTPPSPQLEASIGKQRAALFP